MRYPNTELGLDASQRLYELMAENDRRRKESGLSVDEVVRLNLARAKHDLRKRRART